MKKNVNRKTELLFISLFVAWALSIPFEGLVLKVFERSTVYTVNHSGLLLALLGLCLGILFSGLFKKSKRRDRFIIALALILSFFSTLVQVLQIMNKGLSLNLAQGFAVGLVIATLCKYIDTTEDLHLRMRNIAEVLLLSLLIELFIGSCEQLIAPRMREIFALLALFLAMFIRLRYYFVTGGKDVMLLSDDKNGKVSELATEAVELGGNDLTIEKQPRVANITQLTLLIGIFNALMLYNIGLMHITMHDLYTEMPTLIRVLWLLPFILSLLVLLRFKNWPRTTQAFYFSIILILLASIFFMLGADLAVGLLLLANVFLLIAEAIYCLYAWAAFVMLIGASKKLFLVIIACLVPAALGMALGLSFGSFFMRGGVPSAYLTVSALVTLCFLLIIGPQVRRELGKLEAEAVHDPLVHVKLLAENIHMGVAESIPSTHGEISEKRILTLSNHDEVFQILTAREKEIFFLVLKGAKNAEIAEALQLSENTVKTHVRNILNKYGVKNRTEMMAHILKLMNEF